MAIATKGIHRVPLRKRRRSRPVAIYLHLCGLTAPLGFLILSGRNSALLHRSPLRTGLASFPASGSSLFKAPFDQSR